MPVMTTAQALVKLKSGNSFILSNALRKVATISENPSCHRHNQTGSKWALPIKCNFAMLFLLLSLNAAYHGICKLFLKQAEKDDNRYCSNNHSGKHGCINGCCSFYKIKKK